MCLSIKNIWKLQNNLILTNSYTFSLLVVSVKSLSFTISRSLLKLISIQAMMPSNHLILCCPILLLPSIFPSIRVFSNEFQLFTSGGQSTGTSASVLLVNIQDLFPLELTGLISLQSKGLSRVFNTTVQKHLFFSAQPSLWSNSHIHTWLLEKR